MIWTIGPPNTMMIPTPTLAPIRNCKMWDAFINGGYIFILLAAMWMVIYLFKPEY